MDADLLDALKSMDAKSAAAWLMPLRDDEILSYLERLPARNCSAVWRELSEDRTRKLLALVPEAQRSIWQHYSDLPENACGMLMERPAASFDAKTEVSAVISSLRESVRKTLITYVFVVDSTQHLVGIVTFRELLYSDARATLEQIMLRNPFALKPDQPLDEAMREVVKKHFPVYPVVSHSGQLLGQIRGQSLFEAQAVEISAQAGQLVGVEKEERLSTSWKRSFVSRHPWLLLNLLTAFVAGAVVSFFETTVDKIALLAVFLPVLAGQSGNTGCQALAVTLRGLTLGELTAKDVPRLLRKESLLGLLNGTGTGLVAGTAMYIYARLQGHPNALTLALITLAAMIGACVCSGLAGASVPLTLKKLGADPATASSIFLTTATDVVSMGLFLGLATALLL